MVEDILVRLREDKYHDNENESKWLHKHIDPSLLEKEVSSLLNYMVDPNPDRLNERGYTPIQQEIAEEIKPHLKKMTKEEKAVLALTVGALQLQAKTIDGTKFMDLEDKLKDHADIILTVEGGDDIGQSEQKMIDVIYSFIGSGQIVY